MSDSIYYVLGGLLALYAVSAFLFLVMDNRSPQSTFAWLFLFYIFPPGGMLIYLLFGRGRHAFSDEAKLMKQFVGGDLSQPLASWLSCQILDESIAEALKAAALSGVEVKVMLAPRGAEGDLSYRAGQTYAAAMVRAGVQVYYYQGAYFHPKTIMVDSIVCSVGSANMDIRSFSINYETNLVIYDEATTRKLENDFLNDLEHCAPFSPVEYQNRFFIRLGDSTTRLLSPLL